MTVFNLLFCSAFLLSALVQFNDPDALPWLLVYTAAAAGSGAAALGKLPRRYPLLLGIIALAWMATLLPAIVGKVSPAEVFASVSMQTRAVEEAREIGGLGLIIAWSAVLTLRRAGHR